MASAFIQMEEVMAAYDVVIDLVAGSATGLSREELCQAIARRRPGIRQSQADRLIEAACVSGAITETERRFRISRDSTQKDPSRAPSAHDVSTYGEHPLRIVSFDIESVVRQTREAPTYTEARIFQLGAVRFGRDKSWCHAHRKFDEFVDLPDGEWEIHSDVIRARHAERTRPMKDVLEDFRDFVDGADVLVAYNGTGVDFGLLARAFHRCELPDLDTVRYADGYYLALALWPTPPRQHRLAQLAERVGAKTTRLHWHDALDDSVLLARLLAIGARQFARKSAQLRSLVAAAAVESCAWDLVLDLAGASVAPRPWTDTEVADTLGRELAGTPRRREPPQSSPTSLTPTALLLPPELVDADGHVSPFGLANSTRDGIGEPRPAQEMMTEQLRSWIDDGEIGLIEAPTGTGKSYAMLANALEWLAAAPTHRAIIATFTKQLQSQLAADIQALADRAIPNLALISDLVKGKANRLSLRALATAAADCTAEGNDPAGPRRRRRTPFAADVGYREFVIFLMLRLLAPSTLSEAWEGHSVDGVDIPAFFDDYLGHRRNIYLTTLSQASVGEYRSSDDEISLHTEPVREALANHRLIIANHALLLANLEDLRSLGSDTLLLVDEAHMLEDAATSAMSYVLDYAAIEQLAVDVDRYVTTAPSHPALAEIARLNREFEQFLDTESLPSAAMGAFDDGNGEPGSRVIPVASPRGGSIGINHTFAVATMLRDLRGRVRQIRGSMFSYQSADGLTNVDRFEIERFYATLAKVNAVEEAVSEIVIAIEAIIGPSGGRSANSEGFLPNTPGSDDKTSLIPVITTNGETEGGDLDEESPDDPTSQAAALSLLDAHEVEVADEGLNGKIEETLPVLEQTVERMLVHPAAPNRVVWAEETGRSDLTANRRRYRFRVTSSPIALGAEETWRQFLTTFGRTYFISATLTVAGTWDYITNRLGLNPNTRAIDLSSPFDLANQAKLIALSDFPSWAEQGAQAIRSVAWQLNGYAREMIRLGPLDPNTEMAAWNNGAMVLTTSKLAVSEISARTEEFLVADGHSVPVRSAIVLGNQRAIVNFKLGGGIVVGTKGLWQGVDVDDPDRLRMVWINKLPFPPFADPIIAARRALAAEVAEDAGADDPDQVASETYYLPLAAISLRQAVGRLIRTRAHRGVVIISDRKLAGPTRLRRSYRRIFLGSLDAGLLENDPETGERGGGNVVTMVEGWARIWAFFARAGLIEQHRADELCTPEALQVHTLLPETRAIRELAMDAETEQLLRAQGREAFQSEFLERCCRIGGYLRGDDEPIQLKPKQEEALRAVADGDNVLAVLPTGYGKSFAFQLPALVLPGVTIVVSPLVSLMQNQAVELNRSIGGAVRALVAPLTESNSRLGKAEVADALAGRDDHGIRIVYLSPEKLCTRQFQDLVRQGVAAGIVRRIALDEAHTAVQWGDDFRPSFRRAEHFLTSLRNEFPTLAFTALTATANQAVRQGLRAGLFSLPDEEESTEVKSGMDREGNGVGFQLITANPLRPELAVFRRTLSPREGPVATAGLVEAVVAALDDHAIFYCLTVKEVDALWAQLRDALGADNAPRVRRYHGRLPEAEKAAVVNDFCDAPNKDDDDFVPMIIVATSAFGLGIDRPDIRCVFVVSPPTDLAALYQQLGRAGRDGSGRPVDASAPQNAVLALGTGRGFRLAQWMTSQDLSPNLFRRIAEAILWLGNDKRVDEKIVVDPDDLAGAHLAADFDAGQVSARQARSARTHDEYRLAVIRVVATLGGLGTLLDLGDFPDRIKILAGELEVPEGQMAEVVASVLELGPRALRAVEVTALHAHLSRCVPNYDEIADDPGGTWSFLVDLHALGYLDVSQAPMRRMLTGLVLRAVATEEIELFGNRRPVPALFTKSIGGKTARAAMEMAQLRSWYSDIARCANAGLADYFHAEALPDETCCYANCRCSSCWSDSTVAAEGEELPRLLRAFRTQNPRPVSATAQGRPAAERILDGHIQALLWDNPGGLMPSMLFRVLRGEESYFDPYRRRQRLLWPKLLYSRHRGASPGIRLQAVEASLGRLAAQGVATKQDDARWRLQAHIEAASARAARQNRPQVLAEGLVEGVEHAVSQAGTP